ncbi:MAG: 7-cyano-7-deazaguanine synthase [Candidatus Heimdallarchaeaceae archaeon]
MRKAIVLFSGGMDSTACLYWTIQKYDEITLLSFLYGSKEDQTIIKVNKKFSSLLSVKTKIINLPFLEEFSQEAGSSLTKSEKKPPEVSSFEQLDREDLAMQTAKEVWIPGRNILFLSANKEEGTTFPDNTLDFVNRMNKSIELGCLNQVTIQAPFHDSDKKDIVVFLTENNAKMAFSSSCYQIEEWTNEGKPIHCSTCESCQRRKRAFHQASIDDPTEYR